MRTIKIKSMRGGGYCPANPEAKIGADTMIYAITGVPDDIGAAEVTRQVSKITLAHSLDDPRGWQYDWSELAGRRLGAIINRYKQQRAATQLADHNHPNEHHH